MSSPVPRNPLSRDLRQEMKMTVALKGLSQMKESNAKNKASQENEMHRFFHGEEPTFPSQLKMFCEGHYVYRDFYESVFALTT